MRDEFCLIQDSVREKQMQAVTAQNIHFAGMSLCFIVRSRRLSPNRISCENLVCQ
jgi:hypothetical protein